MIGAMIAEIRSDPTQANEPQHDEVVELWLSAPRTAARYRAAAARARVLQATTTTPRLKRYLGELIARYERRAVDIEGSDKVDVIVARFH
jgi:hypothetical protein